MAESRTTYKTLGDGFPRMTLEMLGNKDPKVLKALYAYRREVFKDGELSLREKELIAMAISSVTKCDICFEFHAEAAKAAGATGKQILEAQEVAMYMSGPSAMIAPKELDRLVE